MAAGGLGILRIIQQLPRVIATAWRDEEAVCGDSLWTRIIAPGGMKKVFEDRLETSLPGNMVFALGNHAMDHVEVSFEGIRFPPPMPAPPHLSMLLAISLGRAGNPVFTDTRRPPRGE